MSNQISNHTDPQTTSAPGRRETTSRSNSALRGPVEPLDGHEDNDHLALIYESQAEQFAAAIPFIREGLERGERCVYVADDNTGDEVLAAMRARGVDVDAALESGALSVHTEKETYRRSGEFDREAMMEFWRETLADATADEFAGLRVTGEMTWALETDTDLDGLCEYEASLNPLYDGEDYTVLCQYNRDRFPADVVHDILKTHPYLVYDTTVCQNVYYTPPEEYFGPDRLSREIDRKLETLVDRTDARAAVETSEYYQREMYEIVSDPDRTFDENLDALFEIGCQRFGLDLGGLARIDPKSDLFEVEAISGEHDHLVPGARLDLSETYCRVVADAGPDDAVPEPVEILDPADSGFGNAACFAEFGVRAYLGTRIPVDGDHDRTFFFVAEEPREGSIPEEERTFHRLMGQWVKYELERRQRERELRERTEHLNALIETTPECIKTVAEDGTLLQMNPAGLEMVEADGASEVTGECVYDLIAPEDRERYREFNERICRGESGTLEFDIVGLDGTRRQMESHAAPLDRPDGTTVHVALTRDVTEQVEREAELRRAKNRFETVFERSNDAMFVNDPYEDEIVDVNSTGLELLGYDRDELLSLGPSDCHPDEVEQFQAFVDGVFEDGSGWTDELTCRTKSGEDVPAEISASRIELDDRELMLAIIRDISERKGHERYQRDLYEITADPELGFDEKLERLLELGRDRFDLEMGGLNHLPSWNGTFRLEKGVGLGLDPDEELWTDPDCYCRHTVTEEEPIAMTDVRDTSWTEDTIYRKFGMISYFGTKVSSGSTPYGTLWFGSTEPRDTPFSAAERSFIDLMGQWVSYEIERREHNESQRELYDITADVDLSTDERSTGFWRSDVTASISPWAC